MINAAFPVPVGNAVQVLFSAIDGTVETRLLRKVSDTFVDQNDSSAFVVYDGDPATMVVFDTATLTNGTPYYYRHYDFDGVATWTASETVSATPASAYQDTSFDVLSLVRTRLEAGLKAVVAAGILKHDNNYIPVYSAPPLAENVKWPIVSVHLAQDAREVSAIGEDAFGLEFNPITGVWTESDSWLSRIRLQIVGWSLNPDQRIALRQAIKAVIIGNLPVFDSVGMETIDFSQMDQEDFDTYAAPVYTTVGDFSCLAPSALAANDGVITGVTVGIDEDEP